MTTTEPTKNTNEPEEDQEIIVHVMSSHPERGQHISTEANSPAESPASSSKKAYVLVVVLLILVAGIGIYSFSSGNKLSSRTATASLLNTTPAAEVSITSSGFVPATVSVKVGQAVTWTNTDSQPHVVASDPYPIDDTVPGFDSRQNLTANDHFSFVFDKAGTYTYHDDLNPYNLEGKVVVQ